MIEEVVGIFLRQIIAPCNKETIDGTCQQQQGIGSDQLPVTWLICETAGAKDKGDGHQCAFFGHHFSLGGKVMAIQISCRTDQKEKEIDNKEPVGKSGFYIGAGLAVQQPADYQQNDTPAVRIEPAEKSSE